MRVQGNRLVQRIPGAEMAPLVSFDLHPPLSIVIFSSNIRGLVQENRGRYDNEIPPGPYTLGSADPPCTFGHRLWFASTDNTGPDPCWLGVFVEYAFAPGDPIRPLYFPAAPLTDTTTAQASSLLLPAMSHRYRIGFRLFTKSGGAATGANLVDVSWGFRSDEGSP